MKPREQRLIAGSLVVGLVLGVVAGIAAGEVLPGTALEDENRNTTNVESEEVRYFLVDMETASTWLSGWVDTAYADAAARPDVADHVATINLIANEEENSFKTAADSEDQLRDFLAWSQAALNGVEQVDESTELIEQLPKDRKITTCLALDADPWSTDPSYIAGVKLYVVVPEGEDKNLPKEWTASQPKNEFDIGWTPLLCDPDPTSVQ